MTLILDGLTPMALAATMFRAELICPIRANRADSTASVSITEVASQVKQTECHIHIGFYYIGDVPVGEDLFSTARPCNNNPM